MPHEDDEINPFSREYTSAQANRAPEFQTPAPPPPRSSGRGNLLVWLIPLLLAMSILPVLCCGGALFWGFTRAIEAFDEPGKAAVAAIEADEHITAILGKPIEPTSGYSVNNYQYDNGNGGAEVDFNIKGPEGSARVTGKMKLFAGVWSPEDLTISCSDGTEFKLPATVEVQGSESF